MLELVVYYKKWGNIMDNEICDFLKIFQLNEILIVTEKDSAIKDLTKKTNYNRAYKDYADAQLDADIYLDIAGDISHRVT